jgi:8-oxo-dGTP pyrophosphatase MutT (NUDIX family)
MTDVLPNRRALYSAAEFRRRAHESDRRSRSTMSWRDHGDHMLNPDAGGFRRSRLQAASDAAVLIPVVDDGDDAKVIFTQRTSNLRKHSGQIAFPGGGIDPEDLSPEQAAMREAEEEIGLDRSFVETLARLPTYYRGDRFPHHACAGGGAAVASISSSIPTEVDEVFEVPLSFLMNARPIISATRQSRDGTGLTGIFTECPMSNADDMGHHGRHRPHALRKALCMSHDLCCRRAWFQRCGAAARALPC